LYLFSIGKSYVNYIHQTKKDIYYQSE